jgi:hypothetical protein
MAIRARYARNSAGQLPAGSIDALTGAAARKTSALKNRINSEIGALELEGALGMHRSEQPDVTNLNISHSTVASLNLGAVYGDLTSSIQTLCAEDQTELAEAVRQLTEAIRSSELDNKKEMLECLAHVSEQATLSAEKRKAGPLKASMELLRNGIAMSGQLMALCERVEHFLKAMGVAF